MSQESWGSAAMLQSSLVYLPKRSLHGCCAASETSAGWGERRSGEEGGRKRRREAFLLFSTEVRSEWRAPTWF